MKTFIALNESFTCESCGKEIPPLEGGYRDHCSNCLVGKHVDINPGDRQNDCRGLLRPIGLKISNSKEQIVYRCEKCSRLAYCKVAKDDDREEIIKLGKQRYVI